jgi:GNAT superfamily N-acetyltransferase
MNTSTTPAQPVTSAQTRVVVTYLEMTDPSQLRPFQRTPADVEVCQVVEPSPEFNRFFYRNIGGDWHWTISIGWTYAQWSDYVNRPGFETWVAYVRGAPAGYSELAPGEDGVIDIAHFGIMPAFAGRGLGGYFLTRTIERAWAAGAQRVTVNTCTLDHPVALANYQARGFRIIRQTERWTTLSPEPPGPWSGAARPFPLTATRQE